MKKNRKKKIIAIPSRRWGIRNKAQKASAISIRFLLWVLVLACSSALVTAGPVTWPGHISVLREVCAAPDPIAINESWPCPWSEPRYVQNGQVNGELNLRCSTCFDKSTWCVVCYLKTPNFTCCQNVCAPNRKSTSIFGMVKARFLLVLI